MWKEKTFCWMTLAVSVEVNKIQSMEIFTISFLVFVIFSVALAIGLLLGRGPIHGSCRPDGLNGSCAKKGNCALLCEKRCSQSTTRETNEC